ncbi:MAG: acetylglutamate kinase [bacterium]|nr:MAG: acetylglutamate kinase [bacterium]
MDELIKKANVLVEALPYIRAFAGKTIVIKYGGKAMTDPSLKDGFATDVVLLKYVGLNPVVVHGGGPQIDQMLKRLAIEPKFRQGVRVTDAATMEIVEMVLGGTINKEIASLISRHGAKAVGLSGKDGGLIQAKPFTKADWAKKLGTDLNSWAEGEDYGLVGDVQAVDASILKEEKLVVLTDVRGIKDEDGKHVSTLARKDIARMVKKGTISEGMLPKVQACLNALEGGVKKAHVIDGRTPHAILLEVFTDKGIGTEIVA